MSIYNVIDLVVLGVIAAFGVKGINRGLVMSLAGGLSLVIGISGARAASTYLTPHMGRLLARVLGEGTAVNIMDHVPSFPWANDILTLPTAYMFSFIFAFLGIALAVYYAASLLDAVVKFPILNLANKLGGLAGGMIFGGAVVWLGVYVLRYFGIPNPGVISNTVLLDLVYRTMPQLQSYIP
ncbi:MAG: CvpA family protein [Defluviitaleaceae bacterium]|nr:CvpA family protein [Defluviitaleaceae bacterium]